MAPNSYARREHYGAAKKWKCVEGASNELKSLHSYSSLSKLHIRKKEGYFPRGEMFLRGGRDVDNLRLTTSRSGFPPGFFLPPSEVVHFDPHVIPRIVFVPSDGSSGYSLCNDYRNNEIIIDVVGVKNDKKWKCVEGAPNELKSLHSYSSLSHLRILKEDGEFPPGNIFLRGTRNMGDLRLSPSRDRGGPPGLFLPTDPGEIVLLDQQAPPRIVFVPSDGSSGYSLCNDYRNNKIKIEVVGVKNEKKWKCAEGTSNVLSMQPLFGMLNGFSIKKKNGEFPSGQMILSGTAGRGPISLFRPDPEDGQEPGYYMLGGTSLVQGEPLRISFSPDDRNSAYSLCDDYRNNKIVIEATGQ